MTEAILSVVKEKRLNYTKQNLRCPSVDLQRAAFFRQMPKAFDFLSGLWQLMRQTSSPWYSLYSAVCLVSRFLRKLVWRWLSTRSVSQRKPLQKYFGDNSREIMVSHADVLIRRYETKDYGFVCKLFYECLIENWIPAYR